MALLLMPPYAGPIEQWAKVLMDAMPDMEIRTMDEIGDPADIEFLVIGRPAFDNLPPLPNLKLMMSTLAGVDGFIKHPALPDVPLVKLEPEGGDKGLTEYALTLVLYHHRSLPAYKQQQARREWKPLPMVRTPDRKVGVLGYGTLGKPIALAIKNLGFDVAAWTKRPHEGEPVEIFAGADQFKPFLARTEIAVALLPLTDETNGILNAEAFAALPEGAAVINLGRGPNLVDADLIAAIDSGHLSGATLDVTNPEPLPPESPLWEHPLITVMPHVARRPPMTQRAATAAEHIRRLRAGEPLDQMIDRSAGY